MDGSGRVYGLERVYKLKQVGELEPVNGFGCMRECYEIMNLNG